MAPALLRSVCRASCSPTNMLRFCAGKLIVCAQRTSSVHCRWSTTHVDGESNRLGNLLTGSPVLMGHLRVVGDAAVAVDRDADRERHQLLRFRIDAFGGRRRCRKSSKGFLDALRGETKIFYGHPCLHFLPASLADGQLCLEPHCPFLWLNLQPAEFRLRGYLSRHSRSAFSTTSLLGSTRGKYSLSPVCKPTRIEK